MAPGRFAYRSLTPNQQRIRLIHILPENHSPPVGVSLVQHQDDPDVSDSSIVCCYISHVSLDDAPPYKALSYTWGDRTRPHEIVVNGSILEVTENLEVALRQLRLQDEPLALWVDALCIDQSDDVEKSEQLQQLRQIYFQAVSVVTWLGPAADNSDEAMQWIQHYGERYFQLGIGTKRELQLRPLLESIEARQEDFPDGKLKQFLEDIRFELSPMNPEHHCIITALTKLFVRPYWTRVWVVQEIASASQVNFVCGKKTVTENALNSGLRLLRNFRRHQILKQGRDIPSLHTSGVSVLSINPSHPLKNLKVRRETEIAPLCYLLRIFRRYEATDPRDKVFALLGIAADTDALGLYPDYRKSCTEVYADVARALIQNGNIELLSDCGSSKSLHSLPSWAPDWSVVGHRGCLQATLFARSYKDLRDVLQPKFAASGIYNTADLKSTYRIGLNTQLLLPAVFLGEIGATGKSWESKAVGEWLKDLQSLSCEVSGTFRIPRERLDAVCRTAVADQEVTQGTSKPRLSPEKILTINHALELEDLSLVDEETFIRAGLGDYYEQLLATARGRRPLIVSDRYLGIGPREAELGDLAFILIGADVPYVLRRQTQDQRLKLIGDAYFYGIMDGEAMEENPIIETITIW